MYSIELVYINVHVERVQRYVQLGENRLKYYEDFVYINSQAIVYL